MLAKYVGINKYRVSVFWEIDELQYLAGNNSAARRYWKHQWHKLRRKADQNLIDEGMEDYRSWVWFDEHLGALQKILDEYQLRIEKGELRKARNAYGIERKSRERDYARVDGEFYAVINGQVSSELYWGPDVGSEILEPYDWGPSGEPPYTPLKWVEGIGWVDPYD